MKPKIGDIVSVRVKISGISEDENNKFSFKIKRLDNNYSSMDVLEEDIIGSVLIVPKDIEEEK